MRDLGRMRPEEVCLPTGTDAAPTAAGSTTTVPPACLERSRGSRVLASQCVIFPVRHRRRRRCRPIADARDDAPTRRTRRLRRPACGRRRHRLRPDHRSLQDAGGLQERRCGPIGDAADGSKCGTASDACHTDPALQGGRVPAARVASRAGYNYEAGTTSRAVAAAPRRRSTAANNCGAWGLKCASGSCINTGAKNEQQWWCSCAANTECWSGCCADGSPPVCSPSSCGSTAKCTPARGTRAARRQQDAALLVPLLRARAERPRRAGVGFKVLME